MDAITRMERRNGPLLRKVGDAIAASPESYNQGIWYSNCHSGQAMTTECKTTACLAGHTVMLHPKFIEFNGGLGEEVWVENGLASVSVLARNMLGLTQDESMALFAGSWRPTGEGPLHERVRDALYALADGACVCKVSTVHASYLGYLHKYEPCEASRSHPRG